VRYHNLQTVKLARVAGVVLVGVLYSALAVKVLGEEQIFVGVILVLLCLYALHHAWSEWRGGCHAVPI
jgi:hypothetical protein